MSSLLALPAALSVLWPAARARGQPSAWARISLSTGPTLSAAAAARRGSFLSPQTSRPPARGMEHGAAPEAFRSKGQL